MVLKWGRVFALYNPAPLNFYPYKTRPALLYGSSIDLFPLLNLLAKRKVFKRGHHARPRWSWEPTYTFLGLALPKNRNQMWAPKGNQPILLKKALLELIYDFMPNLVNEQIGGPSNGNVYKEVASSSQTELLSRVAIAEAELEELVLSTLVAFFAIASVARE
ncbi:hypothetical protein PIB30_102123 [Stylosanthes scabra]|uniref:Uncharacterized protein n=1 Tax=Stylosanthes scabra TaxID=79078 RepID=A0ABU6VW45_9FABA|nr:hypothetical protein [Stylosanthes scabra]